MTVALVVWLSASVGFGLGWAMHGSSASSQKG